MSFWRDHRQRRALADTPCRSWLTGGAGDRLLVLETGLGRHAMERAIGWALGGPRVDGLPYQPTVVLLAGFSGALQTDQPVGALILATEVADADGHVWPATFPGERHATTRRGRVLTTDALVTEPGRKLDLGGRHAALAVDMESAAAARICHQAGVPFGCLRAISDDVDTPLSPGLVRLLRNGRPAATAVLAALARRPAVAVELWRMARNTRIAAGQLAAGIRELLAEAIPAPGADGSSP